MGQLSDIQASSGRASPEFGRNKANLGQMILPMPTAFSEVGPMCVCYCLGARPIRSSARDRIPTRLPGEAEELIPALHFTSHGWGPRWPCIATPTPSRHETPTSRSLKWPPKWLCNGRTTSPTSGLPPAPLRRQSRASMASARAEPTKREYTLDVRKSPPLATCRRR